MSMFLQLVKSGFTECQAGRMINHRFSKGYNLRQRFENGGTLAYFMWILNKDSYLMRWVFSNSDSLRWTCGWSSIAHKAATIVAYDRALVWAHETQPEKFEELNQ